MHIYASLDREVLEKIYELTYKYGWINYDEDVLGWLEEPAYNAKYKIEGELSEYVDKGLEELISTYEDWLVRHSQKGWTDTLLTDSEELSGGDPEEQVVTVLQALDRFGVAYEPGLYEIVAKELGGSQGMIEAEDAEYLMESYGEQFIEGYANKLPEEAKNAMLAELATRQETSYELAAKDMIEEYRLFEELKIWMINDFGWSGEDWLKDVYDVENLKVNFTNQIYPHLNELIEAGYEAYLDFFDAPSGKVDNGKSLRGNIEDIQDALEILKAESTGDLDQRVRTFQYGLTTANHFGTMADHLLDVPGGQGAAILDELSAGGSAAEEWDKELEKILGHPKGSIRKEQEMKWYDPEAVKGRAIRSNHYLILAARLARILYVT
jgi:hypothetical protein